MRQYTRIDALMSLYEKTFSFSEDVDFIYDTCFKNQIRLFVMGKIPFVSEFTKFEAINSSDLISQNCVDAHNVKPVNIYCGIFKKSQYVPKYNTIFISLNNYYSDIYSRTNFDQNIVIATFRAKQGLNSDQERFFTEFLEEDTIKLTIQHELSHWISDALRNKFLTKINKEASMLPPPLDSEYFKLGLDDVDLTNPEIDAQVHEVDMIKNVFSKNDWDTISWEDFLNIKGSSIKIIYARMKQKKLYNIWIRLLATRLYRENLLGKQMIKDLTGKID